MAQIVFLASIREELDCAEIQLPLEEGVTVSSIISSLADKHGERWREVLTVENIRVAINQKITNGDVLVSDTDEVAFLPPVTGG